MVFSIQIYNMPPPGYIVVRFYISVLPITSFKNAIQPYSSTCVYVSANVWPLAIKERRNNILVAGLHDACMPICRIEQGRF